jgi:hypothetical protein
MQRRILGAGGVMTLFLDQALRVQRGAGKR